MGGEEARMGEYRLLRILQIIMTITVRAIMIMILVIKTMIMMIRIIITLPPVMVK